MLYLTIFLQNINIDGPDLNINIDGPDLALGSGYTTTNNDNSTFNAWESDTKVILHFTEYCRSV